MSHLMAGLEGITPGLGITTAEAGSLTGDEEVGSKLVQRKKMVEHILTVMETMLKISNSNSSILIPIGKIWTDGNYKLN